ncbi:MAG TPA: M56 family metallopeptidase [Pirellulales bacterium]|nr:M56 family metallopeptidase [Pirellulales bacterium]
MTGILAKIGGMELIGQPALTRWGTALAHFVWQGAVVAVVAWVLMALVKRATPQVRYAALVVLLAVMAACPVATFWLIGADAGPDLPGDMARLGMTMAQPSEFGSGDEFTKPDDRPHVAPDFTSDGATASKPEFDADARTGNSPVWIALVRQSGARLQAQAHWLVLAWCGGVVVLSIRLVAGIIGLERVKRRGARPAAAIEATVAALARRLRVSRPVRVLESAAAEVPAVVGWLRPYLLLPASAMTGLTTAELEAVLAHELAHVRRHDYLVNVVQIVIETLLFYHPAVWWLSGHIRREREHCCDDWAVQVCGNRVTYARALVALEGLRGPASGLALAVSGGSLRDRVLRLVGRPTPRCRNRSGWFAAALVVLVVAAAAGIGAAVTTLADEPATQEAEKAAPVSDEPGELAEVERDKVESRREPAGPWNFHFRQLRDTGFQVESRVVRNADGNDEQLVDIIGGVKLTLEEPGREKIEIQAESLRIWSDHPMRNDLTDIPSNSPTKLSCRGNVQFRRGTMSLSAKQMTLDLRRKLLVAEGVVVLSPDGFELRADRLERTLDENVSAGVESRGATDLVEAHKLPAATWGEVRDGWQAGVRWKSGRVEHEVGEETWF